MTTVQTFLLIFQVIIAVCLIGFILIQHGRGADAGAAFGSGASSTVFGSRGAGNFLTRATTFLAVLFLGNSLLLGYLASQNVSEQGSLLEQQPASVMMQEEQVRQPSQESTPEAPPADIPVLPEN